MIRIELTQAEIDELRSFIVDSNLEWSLLNQLDNPEKTKKNLKRWLGV